MLQAAVNREALAHAHRSVDDIEDVRSRVSEAREERVRIREITCGCPGSIGLCLLEYIIPPLGIYNHYGWSVFFHLCFFMTLFGYFPGLVFALIMIIRDDDEMIEIVEEHEFELTQSDVAMLECFT